MLSGNMAIAAGLAVSLLLGACTSDSNKAGQISTQNASGQQGVGTDSLSSSEQSPTSGGKLVGVPTSVTSSQNETHPETQPVATVSTARIAPLLNDSVLDNIVLGTGDTPITDGHWANFTADSSWTWQLLGDTKTTYDVDVYVLDMFQQLEGDVIERLHAQNKKAICYFSAGTYEPWRPDAHLFADVPIGNDHYGYVTEQWVDITSPETAKVMVNRMDMAVVLGCDGIELDNVDGYTADLWSPMPTGFDITVEQEIAFQRLLANEAHKRNLAVALKNSVDTIPDVVDYFDLAINEVCFAYDECGVYKTITDADKPVFHVEYDPAYVDDAAERVAMCAKSAELNMRSLIVPKALDGSFRISCDE